MEIRRVGKEVGRQESQCVDGRSNVNCDPEEAVRWQLKTMIYIGNDLVLSPCSVERRRRRILSGGCSDPGPVGSDDDDDVIVISWVYMWV